MTHKTSKEELTFLKESNFIEREYRIVALEDAVAAWEYAVEEKNNPSRAYVLEVHKRLMQRLNYWFAGKVREDGCTIGTRRCPKKPKKENKAAYKKVAR